MDQPHLGMHTVLPARPVIGSGSEAVETAQRFLAALVERDVRAVESHLDANVCSWWTRHGRLASIEGATALSHALVTLVDRSPPTRLHIRLASPATCVTSSLVGDELRWSLELNVENGLIVGAFVRGTDLG